MRFSYIDNALALISIVPLQNTPLQRVVNTLLDEIRARLNDCRRSWWTTRQTTCLANQWAVVQAGQAIALCSERTPHAKQIADAMYNPAAERLSVVFQDGTTAEAHVRP